MPIQPESPTACTRQTRQQRRAQSPQQNGAIAPTYGESSIDFSEGIVPVAAPSSPESIRYPSDFAVDLDSVDHGLSYPEFDVQGAIAPDLYSQSSSLQETEKDEADRIVEGIQKQRQTVRIVSENIGLNTDIVRAGIAQNKFLGTVADFGTSRLSLAEKITNYERAGVSLATSQTRLSQAEEKLYQSQIDLQGTQSQTPLIKERWEHQNALMSSKIQDLRQAVFAANSQLDSDLRGGIGQSLDVSPQSIGG